MATATADKLAIEQLRDAYEMSTPSACSFWACDGSNGNRIIAMKTCGNCASHIMLRRALKRMGILPAER